MLWSAEATELLRYQLRCEARWWTPHLLRFASVLVIYVGWWIATQVGRSTSGRELLVVCAGVQSVVLCLFVPLVMEQRLGVVRSVELWPLLQMSPLRSWEWLIGTLAGPCLAAVIQLLLTAPIIGFAVTLGGVSMRVLPALLVWWVTLLVVVTGLTTLSATTVVRAKKGTFLGGEALGLLWFYNFGVWGIGMALAGVGIWFQVPVATAVGNWLTAASPFQRCEAILSRGSEPPLFESYQLLHVGIGLLGIWTALRVNWPQMPVIKGEAPPDQSSTPLDTFQAQRPKTVPRCGDQPLYWKDCHFIMGGDGELRQAWIFVGLLTPLLLFGALRLAGDPLILLLPCATGGLALLVDFSGAARMLQRELKEQTWSSLRLLPYEVRDHVHHKLRAYWRTVPPRMVLIGIAAALSAGTLPRETAITLGVIALAWPPWAMMLFMGAGRPMQEFGWMEWLVGLIHLVLLIAAGIGIAWLAITVGPWAAWLLAIITSAAYTVGCYYETLRWLGAYSVD